MGKSVTQPRLFDPPVRQSSDTSREAWQHVRQTLTQRELEVFMLLHEYMRVSGRSDATGGELASYFSYLHVTSIRPRLTGLERKGWIEKATARASRAGELRCHPYRPVLPLEALK